MCSARSGAAHAVSASRALALALASAAAAGASAASRGGHRAREVAAVRPTPPGLPTASASSRSPSWRRSAVEVAEELPPAAAARELGGLGGRSLRVLRWSPADHGSSGVILKIGTVVSLLSSTFAGLGNDLVKGYELYFELLSRERDGLIVNGEQWAVELFVCSGDFDAERTGAAFRYLRTVHGISLFLGPYSSALTLAAAKVTQETGAVLVAPGASDPQIYIGRDRVFGALPSARTYIVPAIHALADRGARTLSYVWEDSSGSKATCADVPELSRQRGLVILSGDMVAEHNVSDAVRQLVLEDPDVVVGCVYTRLCIALLQEAYKQDLNPRAFLFSLCTATHDILDATDNLVRYSVGALPQIPISPILEAVEPLSPQDFTQNWQEFHNTDVVPSYHARSAFASCAALVCSAVRGGSTHPWTIAHVLGMVTWGLDANGQSRLPTAAVQFRGFDPNLHIVAPPRWANHSLVYPRPRWRDWICYDPETTNAHVGFLADPSSPGAACTDCPAGRSSEFDPGLGWRVCRECPVGYGVVTKGANDERKSACYLCVRGMMSVRVGGSGDCKLCPKGRFQDQEGQTACSDCPAGRFTDSPGATICASCTGFPGLGTFYNAEAGSTTCYRCPNGGLCEPDAQGLHSSVTNAAGFYMPPGAAAGGQARMYRCSHGQGKACLSHGRCHRDRETGEVAMEGIMCGRCVEGFGRLDSLYGLCEKCEGVGMAVLGLLFNAFLGSCFFCIVLLITFNTDFTKPLQIHSVIMRQFMNYIQMALIVTERLGPQLLLLDMHAILKRLSFFTSLNGFSDFSLQCLSWATVPNLKFHQVEQFIGLAAIPLMLLLLGGLWELVRRAASSNGWPQPSWRRLVAAAIVTLFSMISPVTERNLASWKCHHFDVLRLASAPSEECQAPKHRAWQLAGGIGLIAFSLGIPLVLYHLLRHYHHKGRLPDEKTSQMIGFLTSGFEPQFWYFECVFMLRKVLFHLVVVAPNLFTEGAERARTFQNTVLLLLSGSFFFLHLYYQPFDNRCHYILDKIETASLLAIMMTPLLQRWIWETNQAFTIEGNNIICITILAVLHGRVLLLIVWGLVRGAVKRFLRESSGEHPWLRRSSRLLLSSGEAYVRPSGFFVSGVKGEAESLLCDMVQSIVRLHIRQAGVVNFEGLAASLQHVAVEALHMRQMEALKMDNPVSFYIKLVRQKVDSLRVGKKALSAVLTRLEEYLRKRGWKTSVTSESVRSAQADDGVGVQRRSPGPAHVRSNTKSNFDEVSVLKTWGKAFTIEELHVAMLRLGTDAYQEASPVESLLTDGDLARGDSRTTNLTDLTMGVGMTTLSLNSRDKGATHGATALSNIGVHAHLSVRQLLVSELRAAREDNKRTMADLEGRRQDSQKLLDALRSPGETALGVSKEASQKKSGAAVADEDMVVASEHVLLEDFGVNVESSLQPTRASVVPRIAARPSPTVFGASLRPVPFVTKPREDDAIGEEPPRGEASAASVSRPAAASASSPRRARADRAPAMPPLPLAAAAGPARAQAVPTASSVGKAMLEGSSDGLTPRRCRTGPIQRKRHLAAEFEKLKRQRDATLDHIERSTVEAESLLLMVSRAQRELRERNERTRALEERLVALEADSARLRRWAEGVPCTDARVDNFCGDLLFALQGESSSKEEVPRGEPAQEATPRRGALRSPGAKTSSRAARRSK